MSEKKKFTLYAGSVALWVCTAVLLHYVSFTNPYLQSICHLLSGENAEQNGSFAGQQLIYVGFGVQCDRRERDRNLRCAD